MDKMNRTYPWGHKRRYNAYTNYIRSRFGGRVQKLSLNAGFTCPNRDGSKGRGGCSYCNNDAFSPSYCQPEKSIRTQLEQGIAFHQRRYRKAVGYMAYFQAYSNTYDRLEVLEEKYAEALSVEGVAGLVIGTRPDCIDEAKLDLLGKLSENVYISLELGIESCYDHSLQRINRGHSMADTYAALELCSRYNFDVGGHFILGLPGESREELLQMPEIISRMPLTTAKFHQLQILKDTAMAEDYRLHPADFIRFSWEEYQDFLIRFLELLRPGLVIERLTGESAPGLLLQKEWGLKRTDGLTREFEEYLEERDSWQGKYYKSEEEKQ